MVGSLIGRLGVAVATLGVLVTSACAGGGAASPTGPGPSTATATATATAPSAGGTTGGASSTGPTGSGSATPSDGNASLLVCTPTVSTLTVAAAAGGDGHQGLLVHVRNGSDRSCVTTGYPGVALLGSDGTQLLQATRTLSGYLGGLTAASQAPQLTLAPGAEATAMIEAESAPDPCRTYPAILFTLPDNTDSTRLNLPSGLYACAEVQVHPLLAGDTGTDRS